MIRSLLKWSWYFLVFVLCLMALTIMLTYALIGTESGFKLTSDQLNQRIPGLTLVNVEGNLLDGIKTSSLVYENEQLTLQASGIKSRWSSELFGRKLKIEQAIIDQVDVELFAANEPVENGPRENITLPEINLPLSFNAETVLIKQLRIKPPGDNAPIQIVENIRLAMTAQDDMVTIHHLQARYQNITTTLNGDIELSAGYPLSLDITTVVSEIAENIELRARTTLSNSLEKLHINSTIQSPVQASLNGIVAPLDKALPAQLRLKVANAGWPVDTEDLAKLSNIDLAIEGNLEDYEIALSGDIEGEAIPKSSVSIRGFANPEKVLLPKIALNTLDGTVTGKGGLLLGETLTWVANLEFADINPGVYQSEIPGNLNGNFVASGEIVNQRWSIDLTRGDLDGELRGLPFTVSSKLNKSLDNVLSVEQFTLDNDGNHLETTGSIDQQWNMVIDANLPQLQNFLPGLAGGFKANGKVSGALEAPDITLDANAAVIKLNDLLLRGLKINANVVSAGEKTSSLSITADNLNQGTNQLSNIALKLKGTRAAHTLSTFFDGPSKTSLDLLASGSLKDNFDWSGSLDKTKIELPGHNLHLQKPLAMSWQQQQALFTVDPHCWISVDASVCLENPVKSTESGNANVVVNNYKLEQLNLFLPAVSKLKGVFTADTTLYWGSEYPGGYSAVLDAKIENGTIRVTDANGRRAEFEYKSFGVKTEATAENIDASLTVDSSTMGNANILFNMNPSSETKDISGRVSLDGLSVSIVKAFLPEFQTIEGVIKADGEISGSLSDPKFDGNVHLNNLQLAAEILPLSITGGDITTRIKGSRAFIFGELESGEGILDVEGNANWRELAEWSGVLNITGKNLSVIQNPITESSVNPDITISLRPGTVDITGKVTVPSARINIKEIPKGATTLSPDIIIIEDQVKDAARKQELEDNNIVARIKIDVSLGDDVQLSGYGLDASLAGDMTIRINTPNPVQLGGELRIVRGVYKSYGQNLTIEDGQILFVGPIDQTSLDMNAVREIEGEDNERKAGLHLAGKLSDPEVTLFTDPADKSQEAILSYIVLGRDIAEASDQESSLLASAALALTLKGGNKVGKSIADGLGIKEFELDARGKGDDTELIVSGRLNDRLLLRYGQNVFEPGRTLYLRYDITKKLYLEAARGIEDAVDLFYSFSF